MRYTVSAPASLHAAIQLPASKSISNRALILHSLAHGNILPRNLSDCDDTIVMTRALDGNPGHIDILAAGTAMRFLTAYLSVTPGTRIITGTQRMQQRPIRILVDALRELGARIEYVGNEGFPPLRITGTELTGSEISLAGNVSSQYISALLMIGTVLPKGLRLHLTGDIISRPYINPDPATDARLRRPSRLGLRRLHHRQPRRIHGYPFHRRKRLERRLLLVSDDGNRRN